jgi:hypothetical protein
MPTCGNCGRGFAAARPDAHFCSGRCRLAAKRKRDRQRRVLSLEGLSSVEQSDFTMLKTWCPQAADLVRLVYQKHGREAARLTLRACKYTQFPRNAPGRA